MRIRGLLFLLSSARPRLIPAAFFAFLLLVSRLSVSATVRSPGFFGGLSGDSKTVTLGSVTRAAQQVARQQGYPLGIVPYLLPQAGQQLIMRKILEREADAPGLSVSDADLKRELR